jgi:hypothetical protein
MDCVETHRGLAERVVGPATFRRLSQYRSRMIGEQRLYFSELLLHVHLRLEQLVKDSVWIKSKLHISVFIRFCCLKKSGGWEVLRLYSVMNIPLEEASLMPLEQIQGDSILFLEQQQPF